MDISHLWHTLGAAMMFVIFRSGKKSLLADASLFNLKWVFLSKQTGNWSWEKMKLPTSITANLKISHLCQLWVFSWGIHLPAVAVCYLCFYYTLCGFRHIEIYTVCVGMHTDWWAIIIKKVLVWLYDKENKGISSSCHLLLYSRCFLTFIHAFSSTPLVWSSCCPYLSSPSSFLPQTPSAVWFSHTYFQRTHLPLPASGCLALQAWHCAMVEEGLCHDASWLRVWDFRRLDQRREVKGEEREKELLQQKASEEQLRERNRGKMD